MGNLACQQIVGIGANLTPGASSTEYLPKYGYSGIILVKTRKTPKADLTRERIETCYNKGDNYLLGEDLKAQKRHRQ